MEKVHTPKSRSYSSRFKTQLILSFMIMSFFLLTSSSVMIYIKVLDIMDKQLNESTQQRFTQSEYNINNTMDEIDRITKRLIVDPNLQNIENYGTLSEIDRLNALNGIQGELAVVINNDPLIHSIYIFGENGEIFGSAGNRFEYLSVNVKEIFFYNSEFYRQTKRKDKGLTCTGDYYAKNFDMQKYSYLDGDMHLITAARGVKDISQTYVATIVVNLYETAFKDIYNKSNNNKYPLYLTDEKGIIISCYNATRIMSKSEPFQQIQDKEGIGNFIYDQTSGKIQVIYKKLAGQGWYIVSEIPYKIYFADIRNMREMIAVFFIGCIIISFAISSYWIYRMTKPLKRLSDAMQKIEQGDLCVKLDEHPQNELGFVARQFNQMSESVLELIEKNKQTEVEKREYEIESLRSQINPHFLYNSLNIVKWMAFAAGAPNVADAMTALGNILKPVFKENSHFWRLRDEVSYLKNYIKIMNYRFGEGLTFKTNIPDKLEEVFILRFILQPIVENSIIHCLTGQRLTLEIDISAEEQNQDLEIYVRDDGYGIDGTKLHELIHTLESKAVKEKTDTDFSIGLANVNKRIKLHFGDSYGLMIISEPGKGTSVLIKQPLVLEKELINRKIV